jgi:hypothetical protein
MRNGEGKARLRNRRDQMPVLFGFAHAGHLAVSLRYRVRAPGECGAQAVAAMEGG